MYRCGITSVGGGVRADPIALLKTLDPVALKKAVYSLKRRLEVRLFLLGRCMDLALTYSIALDR